MLSQGPKKTLHLIRHGVTEMNVHLHKVGYPPPRDPLLWDTILTKEGERGASRARDKVKQLNPQPQVLLVSPLARTLQTADLAFAEYKGTRVIEKLARERLYLSSDAGSTPDALQTRFPLYDFSSLETIWWFNGQQSDPRPKIIEMEPEDEFKARCEELKIQLANRKEEVIALVSHWGVLRELTGGYEFENVELRTYLLDCETKQMTIKGGM
jgi:broad specificity phosphatase PhoE